MCDAGEEPRPPSVLTRCVIIQFNLSRHFKECVKSIRAYNSHKIRMVSPISALACARQMNGDSPLNRPIESLFTS